MSLLERVEALQATLRERGTDLVVVGPTTNMRYLTGYRPMAVERITVLLVAPDAVAMVMPYFDADEFRHATGLDAVFEWTDKQGPSDAIEQAFRAIGLSSRGLKPLSMTNFALISSRNCATTSLMSRAAPASSSPAAVIEVGRRAGADPASRPSRVARDRYRIRACAARDDGTRVEAKD
jgi:Xaa-Pro aminopeptidase